MNKRRKSIAIALACAMLVGTIATTVAVPCGDMSFGMTVSAADIVKSGSCGADVTYILDSEGTLTITGTGMMKYDGSPFYENLNIKKIIIKDGVTSIGASAFQFCSSLTSIEIPDSVTRIEVAAFSSCASLTSITIPDGVTSIGENAFEYCSSLTSITIPDGVTSIGENAFEYCSSLTRITIPDSVMSIENNAFYNCTSLASITIPNSVKNIGDYAFADCTSITRITIPAGVTSIGYRALGYYSNEFGIAIDKKQPNFTIEGYSGTEAERYANHHGFEFVSLVEAQIDNSSIDKSSEANSTIVKPSEIDNSTINKDPQSEKSSTYNLGETNYNPWLYIFIGVVGLLIVVAIITAIIIIVKKNKAKSKT